MLLNSNLKSFQNQFQDKLSQLLSPDELGSFILVLANSMQEEQLQKSLAPELETTFQALINNPKLQAAEDDNAVFESLKATGITQYTAWKNRQIKHWRCALNTLRALRPERASKDIFDTLKQDFNDNAFHFAKPFLRPEIISEETFEGIKLQLMYHKFPFAPYHLLIVLDAHKQRPQFMDEDTHQMAWNLTQHIEKNMADFGMAYNSIGAGASINHLHIHGFIKQSLYAVELPRWKHNGGDNTYPLEVGVLTTANSSWQLIEQFHQTESPYNLLYRAGVCYVIKRQPQNSVTLPDWLPSIGWVEACGGFNLSDESFYQKLSADNIETTLSSYF